MVDPVTSRGDHADQRDGVVADLVEYFIVAVPDVDALSAPAAALVEAVNTATIRVLDLVVVAKDDAGAITAVELDSVEGVAALRDLVDGRGVMLSEHDIALASVALRPGRVGLIVVTEDRWARRLSTAAQEARGQIVAGERISVSRVGPDLLARPPCAERMYERDWSALIVDPTQQLETLADLLTRGLLSPQEYADQKAKVLEA